MPHSKFLNLLMDGETLFKNEEVFDPSYLPEEFIFRNSQMKALAMCIKPAMRSSRALNTLLYGSSATGKTTAIKTVFNELENTENVECCYVNCRVTKTMYSLFAKIYENVTGRQAPETGTSFSTLYEKILKKIKNKVLIIAFDDFDFLERNKEKVLSTLLRTHEMYPVKISVWLVSKNNNILFDTSVRSMFSPEEIHFPDYTKEEIKSILKNRIKLGLYHNCMENGSFEKILNFTMENDLRRGIELIKKSALNAETEGARSIREEHVHGDVEKTIEDILKKESPIESSLLFEKFRTATKQSYSQYCRNILNMNVNGKLIIENQGRTRIISLNTSGNI